MLKSSRDKKSKARTVAGGGEERLLCNPGSEVSTGREREKKGEYIDKGEKT